MEQQIVTEKETKQETVYFSIYIISNRMNVLPNFNSTPNYQKNTKNYKRRLAVYENETPRLFPIWVCYSTLCLWYRTIRQRCGWGCQSMDGYALSISLIPLDNLWSLKSHITRKYGYASKDVDHMLEIPEDFDYIDMPTL